MNAYNCHFLSLLVLLTLNWTGKIGSILAPSLKRPPSFSPAFREPNYGFGESRELKFNSVSPLTKKARLADHRVDLPFPVEIPEAPRLATRPLLAGNPVQNPDLSIAEISGQGDIGARKLSLDHTGATTSTDQLSRHKGHPGLMTMEDWMIQQIRVCSARYSRILDSYSSLRLSHLEPNEVHGMTQEWNAGAPVVMSTIKLEGGRVRSLNWIVNKDRSDCAVGQLNIRFMSLIHLITCYHSELLKVMGIDPSQIRSQNEALIKWLLAEIFNPSTGFPIIGWAADQSEQAEGAAKQGSPLRDLDKILSIYLSRSDQAGPNPGAAKVVDFNDSTTACILINYWYRSEQSQFFQEKFSNDQHHLMSLLRQIQMKLSVPNHPFSHLKGLPQ
ncbi:hypothetical protein MJO28_014463 [Puccinia striiformis f. sp. tritici]|uniref:Uncharacterized protein n=1 Tax=Puccinia striiformis f. sp. tritici TaxID=168172 RepID=A0ACC0DTK2_9BASI|nr:hypothetical protein MJO28_014463 [Puccinia striiformis f. sp. tritici]